MNLIQAQLGHSSLATTSRYLAHIAPQELVEAMKSREWSFSPGRRQEAPQAVLEALLKSLSRAEARRLVELLSAVATA